MAAVYVGVDLAWGYRARTGLAAVDESGRLLDVTSVRTDEEIVSWVDALEPEVVAIDAPLVVTNAVGMRECERAIARAYSRYGASCHTSNSARMPAPRAAALAQGRWAVDARPGRTGPVCVEVYPHAALVGLFELPYRVAYKKGTVEVRRTGFERLVGLLEGWPVLGLDGEPWRRLTQQLDAATRQVDLDHVEDQLDAVVCAGLALLHHRGELVVYGDPRAGHVVAPRPPTHPAVRPSRTVSG
jgi:predicted RNase H-like nuclease